MTTLFRYFNLFSLFRTFSFSTVEQRMPWDYCGAARNKIRVLVSWPMLGKQVQRSGSLRVMSLLP